MRMDNKVLLKTPNTKEWLIGIRPKLGKENTRKLRTFCEGKLFIGHLSEIENQIILASGLWTGITEDVSSFVTLEIIEDGKEIDINEEKHALIIRIPLDRVNDFTSLMVDEWGKSIGKISTNDISKFIGVANLCDPRIVIRGQFTFARLLQKIDQEINWTDKNLELCDWIKDYDERSMNAQQRRAHDIVMKEARALAKDFYRVVNPLKLKGTPTLIFHCAFDKNDNGNRTYLRYLKPNEIDILSCSLQSAFQEIYGIDGQVQIIQHHKKLPESKERVLRVGCHILSTDAGWRERLPSESTIWITSCVENAWLHLIKSEMKLDAASNSR